MEPTNTPMTTISQLPIELEIQIISYLPFSCLGAVSQVCSRWKSIVMLEDSLYDSVKTQLPTSPPADFKMTTFKLHKAAHEIYNFFGLDTDSKGFRYPSRSVIENLKPFRDQQLTIPPMPHTLQDVNIHIAIPPCPLRTVRPGYIFKVIPVPCRPYRKLWLKYKRPNTNNIDISNFRGKKEVVGLTVGELFDSIEARARIRAVDAINTIELRWRVRDRETEWWWKEWDLEEGLYEMVLFRNGKVIEDRPSVWVQRLVPR